MAIGVHVMVTLKLACTFAQHFAITYLQIRLVSSKKENILSKPFIAEPR